MRKWQAVSCESINENVFNLIGKDWMLVSAGTPSEYNTMTASWGGMGVLWKRPVATIYVRPHRYTYEFMEKHDFFTLSFLDEGKRDILRFCGSNSGRDVNKAEKTGLTPVFIDNTVYFEQARLVFVLKKIYFDDINPNNFLDDTIKDNYPLKDYHRMYVGEIVKALI